MSMLPKKPEADSSLEGQLVVYEHNGAPLLAHVQGIKKGKCVILNSRERRAELPATRLHTIPQAPPKEMSSNAQMAAALSTLLETAEKAALNVAIEELWEFVHEEKRDFEVHELAKLYFGKRANDEHLPLFLALTRDRIYFKRKKYSFAPREPETVQELIRAEAVTQEKERIAEEALSYLQSLQKRKDTKPPAQVAEKIEELADLAAAAPTLEGGRLKEAQKFLKRCQEELGEKTGNSHADQAFALLCRVGYFSKNQNLALIRHKPLIEFTKEEVQQAEQCNPLAYLDDREDLTTLECVTIDDDTTRDMDDALSLQTVNGKRILGIHITDVGACLPCGSALDKAAQHRATSIYLPERTIHMLPEALAENKLSLIAQETRPTISCFLTVESDGAVSERRLVRSIVRVSERKTYREVDSLLEDQHPDWTPLYETVHRLLSQRLAQGASVIHKRDVAIQLGENDTFELIEFDEHGPARGLVGECMIAANEAFAEFARENDIPFIFRSQEAPSEEAPDLSHIPEGPARDYARRSQLQRSVTSCTPGPHATLGIAAYAQVTSPIRRYLDLCNQRQIACFLQGEDFCYSREDLEAIMTTTEEPQKSALLLSRETKRYWLLQYLAGKKKRKETLRGVVLKNDMKSIMLELDEVFMPCLVKLDRKPTLGEELTLRIIQVQPHQNYIKLEEA